MPKVTQEYMDARRAQILDAARRCFLREGFHSTSMQDLFAESGLSAGAVYRHFASKNEMITAIVEENMRDVLAMVNSVARNRPSSSIGDLLADVLEIVKTKTAEQNVAGLAVLAWSESLRNPSLAKQFDDLMAQMRSAMTDVIRENQQGGNLTRAVSAEAIAATLMCMLPGYILQLAMGDSKALEGVSDALRALWPDPATS
ncbi:TetR/AcrR family transcriptional regulator [Streptomyces sp. NBC_01571]|uniref:TetR/AcrR family transcriptional regulator n=1 Tax=unclassified Streptomyces TaxID=2593676 RepID=UPI00224DB004|nr:TetR/AcrR family transcriptional regulator [Streptomyces sp. NBC_01571]MCX4580400.1 TetR/AcrR family transcriptional regulator [Streptomyces sp. NBC_01571]